MEQRVSQQDSANRGILEQLMKIQQDFKVGGTGSFYWQDQDMIAHLYVYINYVKCSYNDMHVMHVEYE